MYLFPDETLMLAIIIYAAYRIVKWCDTPPGR
jgi:hypothetical protein